MRAPLVPLTSVFFFSSVTLAAQADVVAAAAAPASLVRRTPRLAEGADLEYDRHPQQGPIRHIPTDGDSDLRHNSVAGQQQPSHIGLGDGEPRPLGDQVQRLTFPSRRGPNSPALVGTSHDAEDAESPLQQQQQQQQQQQGTDPSNSTGSGNSSTLPPEIEDGGVEMYTGAAPPAARSFSFGAMMVGMITELLAVATMM